MLFSLNYELCSCIISLCSMFWVTILSSFNVKDGGSLDKVLKKAGRIPEDVLGTISIAVS